MNGINNSTQAANKTTAAAKQNQKSDSGQARMTELDKDAFFKLLITQLKYQDPLKPMANEAFVAQMAQFSSLEQMQNMNKNMKQFLKVQGLSEGASLIGKTIETYANKDGKSVKGKVVKVTFEEEGMFAYLKGLDEPVSVDVISAVY